MLLSFPKWKTLSWWLSLDISIYVMLFRNWSQRSLANRLKKVLSLIILMSQIAFVLENWITDNILVNFETLHHMKIHNIRRKWFITVKLDTNKTYDMVEWVFLKQIMRQLSFHDKSITLMIECISIVSYSIMVNEELKGLINYLGD